MTALPGSDNLGTRDDANVLSACRTHLRISAASLICLNGMSGTLNWSKCRIPGDLAIPAFSQLHQFGMVESGLAEDDSMQERAQVGIQRWALAQLGLAEPSLRCGSSPDMPQSLVIFLLDAFCVSWIWFSLFRCGQRRSEVSLWW
jgi:hypothetical protein